MIKTIKSLSIHLKLTLLMVVISMIVLSGSAFLFYKNQVSLLESSVIDKINTQASLIAASVGSAIIFADERSAEKTIALLSTDKAVEYAAIIFPDKTIFARYVGKSNVAVPKIDLLLAKYMSDDYLDIVHKIVNQGDVIGYVYIKSNLNKLKRETAFYQKSLAIILFFSIILTYILAHFFQKSITVPIDLMVSYVTELSISKDYTKRLEHHSGDELGTLAQGFNDMLTTVQEHEKELKNHSDNLQQLVDKRTKQLYQRAHYDSLTELPNRALLLDRLNHAIATAKRKKTQLAVLFMDLDRFKIINDSLGHDVGDELLQSVGIRLTQVCRESDTIARLGGDEFVFLIEEINTPEDPGRMAKKINNLFTAPFYLRNHTLHAATSIGVCIYPEDGKDSETLLKNADVSMYHSKKIGPGGYCFYKTEMNELVHKRLEIENILRGAQDRNEFKLVYQPQVHLATNKITKAEALLRWHNPQLGDVSPAVFIPIAEEIGLINQIGRFVISQACSQLANWKQAGLTDLTISVNISSSHLLDVGLTDFIKQEVARAELKFTQLEIEITEEVFLEHSESTIAVLKKLQSLGIKIAIDDFGTGYSSLQYLKTLPVNTLKLDGMFVQDLNENFASQGIAASTIILAHSLNMQIIAECVETQAQLTFLKDRNCDVVQGYFFYKPLTPNELYKVTMDTFKYHNSSDTVNIA